MTNDAGRFTLRLTKELKQWLEDSAKRMGVSLNALVLQILWEWAKTIEEGGSDNERKRGR